MAPESERADVKHADDCCAQALTTCKCGALQRHLAAPAVERLQDCVEVTNDGWSDRQYPILNRKQAEAILHSWRERRVQELPILEKFEDEIALHGGFGLTIDQLENLRAALVTAIGKASYPRNSEWREQIRKGAKHE